MGLATAISVAAGFVFATPLFQEAWRANSGSHQSGAEGLIGAIGSVLEPPTAQQPLGWVRVKGERWKARAVDRLVLGQPVRVDSLAGLELVVSPVVDVAESEGPSAQARAKRLSLRFGFGLWAAAVALALVSGSSLLWALLGCPLAVVLLLVSFSGFADAA